MRREQPDRRHVAFIPDWGVWSDWNSGEVRAAGAAADQDGEHVSLRDAADQPNGMFLSGFDRAASAESRDFAAGMAHGYRCGIFRRIHHVFEFRMGNGENVGGGGVAVGHDVRGGQRGVRVAVFGGGNSSGQSVLGDSIRDHLKVAAPWVIYDAPEI